MATVPPGRSTWSTSRSAWRWSSKYMTANWQSTRSKRPSSKGRRSATPCRQVTGSETGRDRQHAVVAVETDDLAGGTDTSGGGPGHHAGAAADIEHGVAGRDPAGVEDRFGPLPEQGGDEELLVDLGRGGGHLSSCCVRCRHDTDDPWRNPTDLA